MNDWQPSADIAQLKQRAQLLQKIRQFFANKQVLEVETPLLASSGVTDLYLDNLTTDFIGPGFANGIKLYLQTSPEFAMKRLIAAGSGCIYQICKAFRNDESGRFHNPEFSILEWYRMGFNHFQLMDETDELLQLILNCAPAKRLTYQQAFIQTTCIDPLTCSIDELKTFLHTHQQRDLAELLNDKTDLLQFIFSEYIEHKIGQTEPCMVYHFPAAQASLAKLNQADPRIAERFEVYYQGIELANGFHELTNHDEQLSRFKADNKLREQQGKNAKPIDYHLLAALKQGLPDCAGIALGIDRLIMLALQQDKIQKVISFDINRA